MATGLPPGVSKAFLEKQAEIQRKLETDVMEIKKIEAEYTKVYSAKQSLVEKKSENEMVLAEFNLMSKDAAVYKLVGPILAKQDTNESKVNVEKRIEYITKEIERMDKLEQDFQAKVEERRNNIQKLQEDMRREIMKE
jgi:prefoldin beta subunit